MTWTDPSTPNLADYTTWLQNVVGIDPAYLPPSSPFIGYALNRAINLTLNVPTQLPGLEYTLAVYNCATHVQLKITPDQVVNGVSYDFFLKKRAEFTLLNPIFGVVSSSSDEGTSVTNAVPDLDFTRTPWGREFLAYQQDYGPSVWGLS